jgi:hypothetical protein
MEPFTRGTPDLTDIDGNEAANLCVDGALIDRNGFRFLAMPPSGGTLFGGKCDVAFCLKAQKKSTADHVFRLPIGLSPVPSFADSPGKSSPVIIRVTFDQIPDEIDLPRTDGAASVSENLFHASMHTPFEA